MRRLVALFVIAVLGAGVLGIVSAPAVRVDGSSVSHREMTAELSAIATNQTLQCFLTAMNQKSFVAGAGADTITSNGASAWTNLRVEGLVVNNYMATKYHPSSLDLANAKQALEAEMAQAAVRAQYNCPGTPAEALAAMPGPMRAFEILAEANSLQLIKSLGTAVPLTPASLLSYYQSHTTSYDTLCISVALVLPQNINAFVAAEGSGASLSTLASRFSVDPSAKSGGSYGCWKPTSSQYATVVADTTGTTLGKFPTTPRLVSLNNSTYGLFMTITSHTTTPFAQAESAVLADLQKANAQSASTVKNILLYRAAVSIDPALGRWGISSSGPAVYLPATPIGVSTSLLTAASSRPYQ
jgi:hypothetical protein